MNNITLATVHNRIPPRLGRPNCAIYDLLGLHLKAYMHEACVIVFHTCPGSSATLSRLLDGSVPDRTHLKMLKNRIFDS